MGWEIRRASRAALAGGDAILRVGYEGRNAETGEVGGGGLGDAQEAASRQIPLGLLGSWLAFVRVSHSLSRCRRRYYMTVACRKASDAGESVGALVVQVQVLLRMQVLLVLVLVLLLGSRASETGPGEQENDVGELCRTATADFQCGIDGSECLGGRRHGMDGTSGRH